MRDPAVGKRIRERLLARGYRRPDGEPDVRNFSFDHRFDKGHLHSWIAGRMMPFKYVAELSEALGCSINWLLTGQEFDPKKAAPAKGRQHRTPKKLVLALAVGAGLWPSAGVAAPAHPLWVRPYGLITAAVADYVKARRFRKKVGQLKTGIAYAA